MPNKKIPFSEEQKKTAIELYKSGLSVPQIACQLNFLQKQSHIIRKFLKDSGVYDNGYCDVSSLLERINKDEFIEYYTHNSKKDTLNFFNITNTEFCKLKDIFSFKKPIDQIKKIRTETNLEKYGVENPFQAAQVKEKIKETCISKYGVEFATQAENVKEKIKETFIEKYGSLDNFYKYVGEKSNETKIVRYGDKGYNNREKFKQSLIDEHGSIDSAYSQFSETRKKTNLTKYGFECALQADNIKEKAKETCILKYGVNHPMKSDEVKNNLKTSLLQKYGVENSFQIPEVIGKIKEKRKQTYTLNKIMSTYSNEYIELYWDRDKSLSFFENNEKLTFKQLSDRFNCPINSVIYWVNKFDLNSYVKTEKSHYEDEIISYIGEELCIKNCRKILPNMEIDIFIPSINVGIEFNGTYWHSDKNLEKNYHQNKSKLAQSLGIHLIHIYQYEWDNAIQQKKIKTFLDLLLNRDSVNRIYARNCVIKQIDNSIAKPFNEEHHLQGHRNAQLTYGLYYNDRLVQLMSFSYNKKNNWWEIIRGCPGSNNLVVGGVSKLLNHFIKNNNPIKIFSYCDFNKFTGISYEKCGMKFAGYTGPDKKYVINGEVVNRNPSKYNEYKEKQDCVIWGAGSKKYILNVCNGGR